MKDTWLKCKRQVSTLTQYCTGPELLGVHLSGSVGQLTSDVIYKYCVSVTASVTCNTQS